MNKTSRIRIGNQTAFSTLRPEEPFQYAVAAGFDAFEWFPDKKKSGAGWATGDISEASRDTFRSIAYRNDIRVSVHATCRENMLQSEYSKVLLDDIAFAHDVGASLMNIHLYTGEGITSCVQSISSLMNDLARTRLSLAIENTPATGPDEFNELFGYIHGLNSPNVGYFGMCLDLGHANLCSATQNDYLKFIDLLDPSVKIIHVHMHENYGDYDSHLPLFTGPAVQDPSGIQGVLERLRKRHFSGCIILEQWPEPPELLNEARCRLHTMIDSCAAPVPGIAENVSDDFADIIADADRQCRSWREKLSWTEKRLTDKTSELSLEQLIYIAVYLRFIGTGELPCSEDGRHYRPHHHAAMSQQIHDRLSGMIDADNVFIIRKIYPWLPSFDRSFRCSDPLTRIRDIAHRNDIPRELKQEIKHKLQNKLHRCAGPEDLAASSDFLEKITTPGAVYSPAFVQEFKLFHKELNEFFNSLTLEEHLEAIAETFEACTRRPLYSALKNDREKTAGLIRTFLKANKESESPEQMMAVFELLTSLRKHFSNLDTESVGHEAQKLVLTDIKLEDFAFVLLSRTISAFKRVGIQSSWAQALRCIVLTIKNLRFSGFDFSECRAIESELSVWHSETALRSLDQQLCLKATLDRCRRMSEFYCSRILTLFPEKVKKLGQALGVSMHAVKMYCEGEIRGHLVFQLSKLVDILLKNIRLLAGLPAWDVIVHGMASGRSAAAVSLSDLSVPSDEQTIVFLENVLDDEEIPAGITGIVAAHETNHLSHFAVRARQQGVVFAVCEDQADFSELKKSSGKQINLEASADSTRVTVKPASCVEEDKVFKCIRVSSRVKIPETIMSVDRVLLPLDQVRIENGGRKAFTVSRLTELSKTEGADFEVPKGVVVPFGVMESSLKSRPEMFKQYHFLANRLYDGPAGCDSVILQNMQHLIMRLNVPHEVIRGVQDIFSPGTRVMVRSSCNCEDLADLASAGLYDSIANVNPRNVEHAIKEVWVSLWNSRAVLSRSRLGINHELASMAVLIQQMLVPDISFIMNTVNHITHNSDEIYIELAVGLGQTLTSVNTPGAPYRMVCNKHTRAVRELSFASFSHALRLDNKGGLIRRTVDYSGIELSRNKSFRHHLGSRLAEIGRFVEHVFGEPQDIEGLIVKDKICLVQSRPQQGV